jgi:hypothetical protein
MSRIPAALIGTLIYAKLATGQATLKVAETDPPPSAISGYDGPTGASVAASFTVFATNPDLSTAHIPFQLSPPDFQVQSCLQTLFVSPSSGTTPATVYVGLNPAARNYLENGSCNVYFATVGQSPVSKAYGRVLIHFTPPPVPIVTAVVGAADFGTVVSPGEIVTIFGANLGPNAGTLSYDVTGTYPLNLGTTGDPTYANTTVTFDGIAAPLLYVNPSQLNVIVPYGVLAGHNATVLVSRAGEASTPFSVAVKDTSPAVFTATGTGTGQGAILNVSASFPYTYTPNGASNPAAKGSYIELFATGAGSWNPGVQDGGINLAITSFTAKPVSVTIGGKTANVYYFGSAPYEPWAMLQLTVQVPSETPSGSQPLVLYIGQNDNSQQRLTVAVQ